MATKAKTGGADIGQVRIPAKLLRDLSAFSQLVYEQVLRAAIARAFARKSGDAAGRVIAEDMIHATECLIPAAADQFAKIVNSREIRHGSRKAS